MIIVLCLSLALHGSQLISEVNLNVLTSLEPVGSVAPRVSRKDEFNHDRISSSKTIAIQCPAQAFPVPFYR